MIKGFGVNNDCIYGCKASGYIKMKDGSMILFEEGDYAEYSGPFLFVGHRNDHYLKHDFENFNVQTGSAHLYPIADIESIHLYDIAMYP